MRIFLLLFVFICFNGSRLAAQEAWMPYALTNACTVSLPGYVAQAQMEGVTLASSEWQGLSLQGVAGPFDWGSSITLAHLREFAEPPRAALHLQVLSFTDTLIQQYKGKHLLATWVNESGIAEIKISVCGFLNGKEGAVLVFSAAPAQFDASGAMRSRFFNSVVLRDAAPAYNYYLWLGFLPLVFVVWLWLRRKVKRAASQEEDSGADEE